jgi:hypothetical protein
MSETTVTLSQDTEHGNTTTLPHTYLGAGITFEPYAIEDDKPFSAGIVTHISDDGKTITWSTPIDFVNTDDDYEIYIKFTPIPTRKGYGVGDVTEPSLDPTSRWAEVLPIEILHLETTHFNQRI